MTDTHERIKVGSLCEIAAAVKTMLAINGMGHAE